MKLSRIINVSVLGGLLASCCCPQQARTCRKKETGPLPKSAIEAGANLAGSQSLVLHYPNPLPVRLYHQEGIYSCWSTSAEMIMEFVGGVRVRQCEQADRSFYISMCCDEKGDLSYHPDCDSPYLPEFGRWGFYSCSQYQFPLTWQEVMAEIDGGRPFAFSWTVKQPAAALASLPISHMMVVIGYSYVAGGEEILHCLNPRAYGLTEHLMVPFSDYQGSTAAAAATAPGTIEHIHGYDYYLIHTRQ